jgi:hypothetical protein
MGRDEQTNKKQNYKQTNQPTNKKTPGSGAIEFQS